MSEERKMILCAECGEEKPHAAHGRCFACFQRARRERDDEPIFDRHNPGIRRDQRRVLKGFNDVLHGLADIGASRTDILRVRAIMTPYLTSVESYLSGADSSDDLK